MWLRGGAHQSDGSWELTERRSLGCKSNLRAAIPSYCHLDNTRAVWSHGLWGGVRVSLQVTAATVSCSWWVSPLRFLRTSPTLSDPTRWIVFEGDLIDTRTVFFYKTEHFNRQHFIILWTQAGPDIPWRKILFFFFKVTPKESAKTLKPPLNILEKSLNNSRCCCYFFAL